MRIGLSVNLRYPEPYRTKPWHVFYQEEVDLAVWAESIGFDTCWVYEHHFIQEEEDHSSAPMVVCSNILARTKRMEVGPNLISPLHDPVLIAEEAATMDLMSGGRFLMGMVQGYRKPEYDGFGIPTKERGPRQSEFTDIVRKCWTGERFSYDGKFWKYNDIRVHPQPMNGECPMFYGPRTPAGLRRAARDNVGIMSQGVGTEDPNYYAAQCREHGREPAQVRHLRYVFIDEDPEKMWAELKEYFVRMMYYYQLWITVESPDPGLGGVPDLKELERTADQLKSADLFTIGTPEDAVRDINELKAGYPLDELWASFRFPGLPIERVAKCMELFANKVIPHIRWDTPTFAEAETREAVGVK